MFQDLLTLEIPRLFLLRQKFIWPPNLESKSLLRRFRGAVSNNRKARFSEKRPRVTVWALIKEPFDFDWTHPPPKHFYYSKEVLGVSWWGLKLLWYLLAQYRFLHLFYVLFHPDDF